MPRSRSGSANGGIIGVTNATSFGKNKVTTVTSSAPSALTTQPGTRFINTIVVAGGGGSARICAAGGGGAGGVVQTDDIPVSGATALGAATIGGGGAGGATFDCASGSDGANGSNSSLVVGSTTYTATGGGASNFSPNVGSTGHVSSFLAAN